MAAGTVDGVAEPAQPVDVAAYGAHGHTEPVGQVEAGPLPAGLQQGQQTQHPGGRVTRHAFHYARIKGQVLS